ncbi:MAG: SurA N-terminal domain-containing protein [Pseudobacteriovorax sp.]|nr:SurA N-terminal domain-containing protein [Pseudobacteriovorax sp.]
MGRNGLKCCSSNIAAIVVSMLFCHFASGAELVDRLLAEVNGDPITLSQVQKKIDKNVLVEVSPYPATEKDPKFEIALQDRINLELIIQRAEELDIEIEDDELEAEIDKFIQRRGLTKDQLLAALKQEGMSYAQYKKDWSKQMVISQFQGREIMPLVKITDKDLEIYYMQKVGGQGESIRLTLKQLFVRIPSGEGSVKKGKEDILKKAYNELKDGLAFSKAVKIYSDNEDARKDGGAMPPVMLKDLSPKIRDQVSVLNPGEFTSPIRIGAGAYIFYLENKEFAGSEEFEQQKRVLEQQLRQQQVASQTTQWLENQRRRSDIKIIRN